MRTDLRRLPKVALKPWVRDSPAGLILRNARVIDPAQSRILDGYQDVVIQDGLIASLTPSPSVATSGLAEFDLAGKFVCP